MMAAAPDLQSFSSRYNVQTDVQLDPTGAPVLDQEDGEELSCSYAGVDLVLGDAAGSLGVGTLYVTTRRLLWVGGGGSPSLGLTYQQVVVHAVSKDPQAFSKPCIYLQLDEGSEEVGAGGDEDEEEEPPAAEIRLVPSDADKVEEMFKALCDNSMLNPDEDAEDDGQGEFFFDEAEVMGALPEDTRAAVLAAQAEQALHVGDDAEGDDDGAGGGGDLQELMGKDPARFEDDDGDEADMELGGAAGGTTGNGVRL